MREQQRVPHEELHDEVPVAGRVEGVEGDAAVEAELFGEELTVDPQRVAGQGTGTEWAGGTTLSGEEETHTHTLDR